MYCSISGVFLCTLDIMNFEILLLTEVSLQIHPNESAFKLVLVSSVIQRLVTMADETTFFPHSIFSFVAP